MNGIITGFKLFFKKKELIDPPIVLTINNRTSRHQRFTGLDEYTEYKFQILAFTSVGDGPNSSVQVKRTLEDGKRSKRCPKILSKNVNVHSYEKNCDQQRNIQFFHFVALRNLSLYNFPKWCQKKFRHGIAITVCGIYLV